MDNNLKELNINDYELSEVLNNLLDNAFEAVDNNNREVILRITNEDGKYIIEIRNKGTTIKPENISKIFKRGFSTKEGKNRGYGLHNVKKIVEHIGGEIQLFFEGDYTIFKVLI
ncbi:Sensor protein CitS [bioreactor metagenome]|uniref:Sensor protein CitS n=1 Tax=bioreactor metagenome TaxID=1076179 RepID=A0A645EQX0_9ZZZZ